MDSLLIGAILVQDGITTGAIYALLGMALVLVFLVTRVILFPQGEFVSYGALTLAVMQTGRVPMVVWLLGILAIAAAVMEVTAALREGETARLPRALALQLGIPALVIALVVWAAPRQLPLLLQCLITLAVVTSLGPLIYRAVYQPLADATVLLLMIVSVGVHFVLVGLGLLFFGVEGFRTPSFWDAQLSLGPITLSGQSIVVVAATATLIVLLWALFDRTFYGKALRASASNATGARLQGISVPFCGSLSFGIAAFIGGLCGLLIAPIVTIYYDSGLLIGLKGFVAAIVGGLASYPMTLLGAVLVGLIESFASFWASSYKEAIVFLLVIPMLLWLSLRHGDTGEEH